MINHLAGKYSKDIIVQECVRRTIAGVRADLEGPSPTALERLLAERAAVCWWLVYQIEHQVLARSACSFRQADFDQRKLDAAHRRFLTAVRTLAQVRKLGLPNVAIRAIGNTQINVSGSEAKP